MVLTFPIPPKVVCLVGSKELDSKWRKKFLLTTHREAPMSTQALNNGPMRVPLIEIQVYWY